jgi:hypothetical protein
MLSPTAAGPGRRARETRPNHRGPFRQNCHPCNREHCPYVAKHLICDQRLPAENIIFFSVSSFVLLQGQCLG